MCAESKKIAVVGGGVSGLTAAWALSKIHEVTLFESADYLGGHANTVIAGDGDSPPVDTGFVVFNELNYPFFSSLLSSLGVQTLATSMSFGVSVDNGAFEYSSASLPKSLLNYPKLRSKRFRALIAGILRLYNPLQLHRRAVDPTLTIGEYLRRCGFKDSFIKDHVLPMTAAIWSTSLEDAEAYPVGAFFDFFNNHRLLSLFNRPSWKTIAGGSKEYIKRLVNDGNFKCLLNCRITKVRRSDKKVVLQSEDGSERNFEEVIFACHADSVLELLSDVSSKEREILGSFAYSDNEAILHSDSRLMPLDKQYWSSWNYVSDNTASNSDAPVHVTYWMNKLHGLDVDKQFFVTLNPIRKIKDSTVIYRTRYAHPIVGVDSVQSARQSIAIQGQNHTWFCGAYLGAGFHEDGVQSGLWVANKLGFSSRALPSVQYSRLPDTYERM